MRSGGEVRPDRHRERVLLALASIVVVAAMLLYGCAGRRPRGADTFPTSTWPSTKPESVGMDTRALNSALRAIPDLELDIHGLLLIRHGQQVVNATVYPYDGRRHDVASVTKSVMSTLIGIALDRGDLPDLEAPVLSFFPDRPVDHVDHRKRAMRLSHLLSMTSGLDCGREAGEAELFAMIRSNDWTQYILDLPMHAAPGVDFSYCSPGTHLLSIILTVATGRPALDYARDHLFGPLGITDVHWPADPQGHSHGWGDLQLRPDDMARLGYLYLRNGRWKDRQIVSKEWIRRSTRSSVENTSDRSAGYGLGWWVLVGDYEGVFEARGRGGQAITVWPRQDLVIAWTGRGSEGRGRLAPLLIEALRGVGASAADAGTGDALDPLLSELRRAPDPAAVPALPAMAAAMSGRRYRLAENALGLSALSLEFIDGAAEAICALWIGPDEYRLPVGLDGVPRFSSGPRGLEVGLVGEWLAKDAFVLRFDERAGPEHYRLTLQLSGSDVAQLRVEDRSGGSPVTTMAATAERP